MIYFAKLPTGSIKIGYSVDPDQRSQQLRAHYGCDLEILHTMDGGRDVERQLHERFSHLRFGRTEQFRPGPDLAEFIGVPLFVSANHETVEAVVPPPTGPWNEGKAVRLDASLASMARAVAIHRGVTIGEYLEPMFAAAVRRDYAAMLRELDASQPPADQPAADDAPARPSRRKPNAP